MDPIVRQLITRAVSSFAAIERVVLGRRFPFVSFNLFGVYFFFSSIVISVGLPAATTTRLLHRPSESCTATACNCQPHVPGS